MVDGSLWGSAVVGSLRPHTLPPDTEERVRDFADLAATAIADAEARAQLTASRARIVAASDNARRRFERDLHDGAQQRLVSLDSNSDRPGFSATGAAESGIRLWRSWPV